MSRTGIRAVVVILHYGDPALTGRLHDQLRDEAAGLDVPLLVLDNAAPRPYPGAWRRLPDNGYWTGGLAYADAAARELGRSHLWLLNNDITFVSRPPHLARTLGRLARLEAAVGPVGLYSPAFQASPYHPQMVVRPGGEYREVGVMDGVAPLLRLECLEAVGGLDCDDNPYGYGVDIVLSGRIRAAGWKLVVDHQVVVRHRHHTAARQLAGFLEQAARAEAAYLTRRLGPDYRQRIAAWQTENREHDVFGGEECGVEGKKG